MEGGPEGGNTVLTRRMAKRQHCPLMPTSKIYEHHVNGVQINSEDIEYEQCTGEECPQWRDGMPGYDDPNRPEWTGKRKAKNFARINAACKGLKTSGGKPPTECPKCGTSHKFAACPVCGCPRPTR